MHVKTLLWPLTRRGGGDAVDAAGPNEPDVIDLTQGDDEQRKSQAPAELAAPQPPSTSQKPEGLRQRSAAPAGSAPAAPAAVNTAAEDRTIQQLQQQLAKQRKVAEQRELSWKLEGVKNVVLKQQLAEQRQKAETAEQLRQAAESACASLRRQLTEQSQRSKEATQQQTATVQTLGAELQQARQQLQIAGATIAAERQAAGCIIAGLRQQLAGHEEAAKQAPQAQLAAERLSGLAAAADMEGRAAAAEQATRVARAQARALRDQLDRQTSAAEEVAAMALQLGENAGSEAARGSRPASPARKRKHPEASPA
jgi:hypothetical protein